MDSVKDILNNYYAEYDEDGRLEKDKAHSIEFITTTKYVEQYLKPGDKILEIGAGTGRYTIYYAKKDFEVDAVELIESNLEKLKEKIEPGMKVNAVQGNSMDLSRYNDNTFDVTLCFGPLYHLFSDEDVEKTISEAIRVTKKGGKIFFAYITNEAPIFNYGLRKGHLKEIEEMCDENFKVPNIPEEIFAVRYIKDFNKIMSNYKNIKKVKELATDGIAGGVGAIYINELSDEDFKIWIKYHLATCEREDLMGCSNHILYIAEKI